MTAARMQQFSPQAAGARKRATSTDDGMAPPRRPCHNAAMPDAVDGLLAILDLEELEVNVFRGPQPAGDTASASSAARSPARRWSPRAARSSAASVHSLHAYFLRPGDPKMPILYQVDRIRDGRTFTTRRVVAIQHGAGHLQPLRVVPARGDGPEHQIADARRPRSGVAARHSRSASRREGPACRREVLEVDHARPSDRGAPRDRPDNPFKPVAARAAPARLDPRQAAACPTIPLLHQCVVAYASDLTLLDTATLPHAIAWNDPSYVMASLDHAMWFHRPFRADEWLLYAQESPSAHGARGFTHGPPLHARRRCSS